MRCIFCKDPSDGSVSVEHIIPESLGNTEHVLPAGVVCDRCNNYFARKIEGPVLDDAWFVHARSRFRMENKRRRIPGVPGLTYPDAIQVGLFRGRDGSTSLGAMTDDDATRWVRLLRERRGGTLILPVPEAPTDRLMARFTGKVALEAMAHRVLTVPGGLDEITDHDGLDELRRFVRVGDTPENWPIGARKLYDENHLFPDEEHGASHIVHEFTLLYTEGQELFFVLAIFGHEFVINMGGPELDGYERWLGENGHASPLYPDGERTEMA